jgi:MFS family permease
MRDIAGLTADRGLASDFDRIATPRWYCKRSSIVPPSVLTCHNSVPAAGSMPVVATTLTTIRQDLGASIEALQWIINAYTLTFGVLLLTGAVLGDRFGRRRMFVVGLGCWSLRPRRAFSRAVEVR